MTFLGQFRAYKAQATLQALRSSPEISSNAAHIDFHTGFASGIRIVDLAEHVWRIRADVGFRI